MLPDKSSAWKIEFYFYLKLSEAPIQLMVYYKLFCIHGF